MKYLFARISVRISALSILVFVTLLNLVSFSQTNPLSPNAASLGMYADVPVNPYTGLPSISIPLLTVSSRDVSIPISLDYHASGIKGTQEASWVGLGWALQAGGVITRTVRDEDDLDDGGYPDDEIVPQWDENNNLIPDPANVSYLQDVCFGSRDSEPDLFYFTLPGHTGKFTLGKRASVNDPYPIHLNLQEKVAISYDRISESWTITTANGYQYEYSTKEYTRTLVGSGTTESAADANLGFQDLFTEQPIVTAWYLDKITSPTSGTITLEYEQIDHQTQSIIYRSQTEQRLMRVRGWAPKGVAFGANCAGLLNNYSSSRSYIEDVYLKRIKFANGELEFQTSDRADMEATENANQNPQKLQQIVLKDVTGKVKRKFVFSYDYFNSGQNPLKSRLKLVNLVEYNGDMAKAPYQFAYDETNPLPDKDSKAVDHWGYYNGQSSNTTTIAALTLNRIPPPSFEDIDLVQYDIYGWDDNCSQTCTDYASCNNCWDDPYTTQSYPGSIRTANLTAAQLGTLSGITYPTGGVTSFTYELHDFSVGATIGEAVTEGGGLRIGQIDEDDGINPTITTRYVYTKDIDNTVVSSGRLMTPVLYHSFPEARGNLSSGSFYICHYLVRQSNSQISIGTSAQGNLVGYDQVTVLHGANGENGKTEYVYRNQEEELAEDYFSFIPSIPNRYAHDNGLLEKETQYVWDGSDFNPIRQVETIYPTDPIDEVIQKGLATYSWDCQTAVLAKFYDVVSEWWYPTSTIVRQYKPNDNTDFQETTTTYEYGNADHYQVTQVAVIDSEGQNHITNYEYAEDFATATDPTQFGSNLLRDDNIHMHSQVLRQITEVDGIETQRVTTVYDNTSGHVLPAQTTTYPSGFAAGNSITAEYNYDQQGNLIHQRGEGDRSTAFLWGYNHEYPIAEVANARQDEFRYTGFEEEVQNVSTDARTGQQSYNAQYTAQLPGSGTYWLTYWQKTGGEWTYVSQTISEDTLIGGAGTLIDDVRVYPLDALMTTYTYDPLYGRTSTMGPDGMIHYQEYDELGRLKLTRDHRGRIEQSYFYHYQQ